MAAIIEARGLTTHFGDVRALDCLDLVCSIRAGHRAVGAERRTIGSGRCRSHGRR
jgi:hypothetical protein